MLGSLCLFKALLAVVFSSSLPVVLAAVGAPQRLHRPGREVAEASTRNGPNDSPSQVLFHLMFISCNVLFHQGLPWLRRLGFLPEGSCISYIDRTYSASHSKRLCFLDLSRSSFGRSCRTSWWSKSIRSRLVRGAFQHELLQVH